MENLIIRRGETLELTIKADDTTAVSVNLRAAKDGIVHIDETETFVDGVATIRTNDTMLELGDYEYTLKVVYSDGFVEILPDAEGCDGDCELPVIRICESLEEPIVSQLRTWTLYEISVQHQAKLQKDS